MAGFIKQIGGWGKIPTLLFMLLATFTFVMMTISPVQSPYVAWLGRYNLLSIAWIFFMLETLIYYITSDGGEDIKKAISIMPFGSYSPRVYIVQRYIGYDLSCIASIIIAITLAIFIGDSVSQSLQPWLPVPAMFMQGQVINEGAIALFTGATPEGRGFVQGIMPAAFEDPVLIYSVIFGVALVVLFIGMLTGVDLGIAFPVGMAIGLLVVSVSFPFINHAFSFQSVEPAYYRSMAFVLITGTPTVLLGFPFPVDWSHYNNNYNAELAGIVGKGQVIHP